ncbi:uncharacterized protein LOC132559575 [Ylistrum balloti]|uniref:uncharacterized protein LOC132559575 n=1 Tax=Ylistrum balloti TaxID=509963 RepID=UPI002905CF21|nr:uncharacterized protein LOC132559575 [Ylistrum balloti]
MGGELGLISKQAPPPMPQREYSGGMCRHPSHTMLATNSVGSSIVGCPDVTPSAVSYVNNNVTWCYWLKNSPESSIYQELMCQTNGGTLANIPSALHHATVTAAMDSTWSASDSVYIGVMDSNHDGVFTTWNEDTLTYTNWANNEPQSYKYCVFLQKTEHKWYAEHCNRHLPAVCYCVIDPADTYTCSGSVVSASSGVATGSSTSTTDSTRTVQTLSSISQTTQSNVCYQSNLASCLSCCYAQTTTTTSSLGTSFTDAVADLKINSKQTNRYQRKLYSAPDHRPLSISIGAVAILIIVAVICIIVTCDFPVIYTQWNILKRSVRRLFCRRPKSRIARHTKRVHPDNVHKTMTGPPTVSTT